MNSVRSVLFVLVFNLATFLQMVFWTPVYFFFPRSMCWKVVRSWGWTSLWLHHLMIGTTFEFRGRENVPEKRGFILASKHHSTWETFATVLFLNDPSYILKRELMFIPFFGWYATKADAIPVNRGKKSDALFAMNRVADRQIKEGRQIVIYPEGTRRAAYAEPKYKYGISHMYREIDAPVLPVALNSGLFWPRNSTRLYRGNCVMEFLPMIEPGLEVNDFTKTLVDAIETRTNELLAEAERDPAYDGPKSRS